jgi:hypothetical protein
MSDYEPRTYVKGAVERTALSAREAVALEFDGFRVKPVVEAVEAPVEVEEPEETPVVETPPTIPTPKAVADKASAKKDDK